MRLINMKGFRCHNLVVVKRKYPAPTFGSRSTIRQARWICQCVECGATKEAYGQHLRKGLVKCSEHIIIGVNHERDLSPTARKIKSRAGELQHQTEVPEATPPQCL